MKTNIYEKYDLKKLPSIMQRAIIEQNENEYSLKKELEQFQQAKSLSKIQKQRLEYIKKRLKELKK